jgi:hypothetical protein
MDSQYSHQVFAEHLPLDTALGSSSRERCMQRPILGETVQQICKSFARQLSLSCNYSASKNLRLPNGGKHWFRYRFQLAFCGKNGARASMSTGMPGRRQSDFAIGPPVLCNAFAMVSNSHCLACCVILQRISSSFAMLSPYFRKALASARDSTQAHSR